MKISYAITVCNEFIEIQRLVAHLLQNKRLQDEIVIQMDLSLDNLNNQPEEKNQIFAYLMKHQEQGNIKVVFKTLDKNFANFKNHLTEQCTGDYIVNIDADEMPSEGFQENIVEVLEDNSEVDMFAVPRVNTVEGLTPEHIRKWGWQVNEQGWINFPDYQMRVYKNNGVIKWINPVHEVLNGFETFAPLPDIMFFHHHKTITKQEKQNELYDTI